MGSETWWIYLILLQTLQQRDSTEKTNQHSPTRSNLSPTRTATPLLLVIMAEANSLSGCERGLVCGILCCHIAAGHEPVNFRQNSLERCIYTRCIESRCLDEGQVVLFAESHSLVSLYSAQVPQIGLVTHEHHNDVGLSMVTQFLQPALDILKCAVF
mmetsp:Transcript_3312/g.8570  ORF Transcript_3312/g.8570 Transcript_3312/m.8570 type:complete len:157 (-) Transcript_3312:727-1197(-)